MTHTFPDVPEHVECSGRNVPRGVAVVVPWGVTVTCGVLEESIGSTMDAVLLSRRAAPVV